MILYASHGCPLILVIKSYAFLDYSKAVQTLTIFNFWTFDNQKCLTLLLLHSIAPTEFPDSDSKQSVKNSGQQIEKLHRSSVNYW